MSLDTKYRPSRYSDVLGQDATIKICREIVRKGYGFRQSYVFAGPWGSGKTTTARIFARALLCESPEDGEPCDKCHQCTSFLADRSETYLEYDAATNSGKDDIKRITEDAAYGTFSGSRRLYVIDESHQLSRQGMDALLKPLEDNIRGTQDKQLVCIFCTTEPEKMRSAILSRCAPVFRIRTNTPAEIATRLAYICQQEQLDFEHEALTLIAEVTECHVRDAIKAIEGISMLGRIDRTTVETYLNLDANSLFLDVLANIGVNLSEALGALSKLEEKVSPATSYEKLADICMMAYRMSTGQKITLPSFWNRQRMEEVGNLHKDFLLMFGEKLAHRPSHASTSMLVCDISALHHQRSGMRIAPPAPVLQTIPIRTVEKSETTNNGRSPSEGIYRSTESLPIEPGIIQTSTEKADVTKTVETRNGIAILPLAQKRSHEVTVESESIEMSVEDFSRLLRDFITELSEGPHLDRPTRRNHLGSS